MNTIVIIWIVLLVISIAASIAVAVFVGGRQMGPDAADDLTAEADT